MDEDHIEKRFHLYESAKKERSPHENKRHKVIQFAFPHMKIRERSSPPAHLLYHPPFIHIALTKLRLGKESFLTCLIEV